MKKERLFYPSRAEKQFHSLYNEIFENKIYSKYFDTKNDDIVVDLGANLGFFSLFASENKNLKNIYMVEPFLENYDYMIRNIIYNREDQLDKFIFFKNAISNKNDYDKIGGDIHSPHLSVGDEITKTIKFMDFINFFNIKKIDYLKIDIEGSEIFIFDDDESTEFIKNNVSKICGEFHPLQNNNEINGEKFYEISKKIIQMGFNLKLNSVDGFDITNSIMINKKINENKFAWDYYEQYLFYAWK